MEGDVGTRILPPSLLTGSLRSLDWKSSFQWAFLLYPSKPWLAFVRSLCAVVSICKLQSYEASGKGAYKAIRANRARGLGVSPRKEGRPDRSEPGGSTKLSDISCLKNAVFFPGGSPQTPALASLEPPSRRMIMYICLG
jgi:hypothetical protein